MTNFYRTVNGYRVVAIYAIHHDNDDKIRLEIRNELKETFDNAWEGVYKGEYKNRKTGKLRPCWVVKRNVEIVFGKNEMQAIVKFQITNIFGDQAEGDRIASDALKLLLPEGWTQKHISVIGTRLPFTF